MYIDVKKTNNGWNKSIIVFYFKDQEDFDSFVGSWENSMNHLNEKGRERMSWFINLIKDRVDDKYKTDKSALSGCMFLDEVCDLLQFLLCIV